MKSQPIRRWFDGRFVEWVQGKITVANPIRPAGERMRFRVPFTQRDCETIETTERAAND